MSTAQRQLQTQHSVHTGNTMGIQNKHTHTTKTNIIVHNKDKYTEHRYTYIHTLYNKH
jgi:hypothetical protein